MLKIVGLLIGGLVLLFFPSMTLAKGEFASSYNVNYLVEETGQTQVSEDITVTNLTETYFPYNFNLLIGASEISDAKAADVAGQLPVKVEAKDNKQQVLVDFTNVQLVGKGKEYKWNLSFKSFDFAQKVGKVWQISIPKVNNSDDLTNYNLSLSVPVSFGDATVIEPEPISISENGGRIIYKFNKDQLLQKGVSATFGSEQIMSFNIKYLLENSSFFPKLMSLPIPSKTDYQEVIINSLTPIPETVTADNDGNMLAYYRLGRGEKMAVEASGAAKLFMTNQSNNQAADQSTLDLNLKSQKYWDKNSPQIRSIASDVLKGQENASSKQRAKLLYDYVVRTLNFNKERFDKNDFNRLGGLTALTNPNQSLSSEFCDLLISLLRASNIPSRQIVGVGYGPNRNLKPLSFGGEELHSWIEFYDSSLGWVMVDPTWENTTSGVDYFNKLDLTHLALEVSATPISKIPVTSIDLNFPDILLQKIPWIELDIALPDSIYASLPTQASVTIYNRGNSTYQPTDFEISAAKLRFGENNRFKLPELPPYGKLKYTFNLQTGLPWQSYTDVISVKVGDQSIQKTIEVKSFLSYRPMVIITSLLIMTMVLLYVMALISHLRNGKSRN